MGRNRPRILIFIFLLFSFACFSAAQTATCNVEWNAAVQISFDSVLSNKPQIALSGDTVHIVWYGFDTLGTVGSDGIQYSRSMDGGSTFGAQQTLLPLESALSPAIVACAGSIVYVAALAVIDTFYGTVLLRSIDGGITWEPMRALLRETRPDIIVASDSSVYIHYSNLRIRGAGLLASTNAGLSWNVRSSAAPHLTALVLVRDQLHGIGPVTTDRTSEVGYFFSYTSSTSWFGPEILSKEDTLPSLRPRLAANERGDLFAIWSEKGKIIFRRSKNAGYSWRPEQLLAPDASGVFSDIAAGSEFVSAVWDNDRGSTRDIRFQNSNDYGATFCNVDTPTAGTIVGEPTVAIAGNRVHVAWTESIAGNIEIVYRRGTLTEDPNSITKPPPTFSLLQNYPNPFNGSTHIRYDIPELTHVRLAVYNLLGQEVATLVDEIEQAARYDFAFDAGNYPSGVYFYQLRTEFFTEVRKLVILR
ncbi:MAG: T9SS type A sorting domain-containing protein [Ignavibacteriae bacterium]|nr:T9SS type A sorting domain-containing protein [Ignavibacteria bacterium]MBI3364663.1 T9SS type A sorting domain-containing protein [Ignavibacteriota bacterium]